MYHLFLALSILCVSEGRESYVNLARSQMDSGRFRPIDEVSEMATITLSDILDDLRAAYRALRKFEQRYWISSADFYTLYSQGLLDDGQHRGDFSQYAEIKSSSLHLLTASAATGIVEGSVWFHNGLELRVRELVDLSMVRFSIQLSLRVARQGISNAFDLLWLV